MKKNDSTKPGRPGAEASGPHTGRSGEATADMGFARSALGERLMEMLGGGSPANQAIADMLLRNPVQVSSWSIETFAEAVAVSPASLSRFARLLGYAGYSALRSDVASIMQALLNPVEKLRGRFEAPSSGAPSPVADSLEAALFNARATADGLSADLVANVVQRLTAARTVYVMGFGLSAHVAALLTLGLQPFCPGLQNVVEFGGTEVAAGRLLNVTKGDAVVVISIPRYASDAVHLTAYARDRGATIIAITDSSASPLVPLADEVLLTRSEHPILSSSTLGPVMVVETLVAALMASNRDNVAQAAKLTEAISSYLYREGVSRPRTKPHHRNRP
jgi:DNA-binding MurR/RpiR family transcriptional regulator